MPAVLDAPEVVDYAAHGLYAAQPQVRPDRTGFWRTLVHYIRRQSVRRCHRMSSSRLRVHTCEAPADLLARQYPTSLSRPMLVYESLAAIPMLPGSPDPCMELLGHTTAARCLTATLQGGRGSVRDYSRSTSVAERRMYPFSLPPLHCSDNIL